ncbi:hypothetical protein FRC10_004729 [Ceratobasidium sp. 414]|nr:hypothetical protein FRC10_004729 [Ceratobasidium sp. 414]
MPLIPQLCGLLQSRDMVAKLRYRVQAEQEYDPNVIQDVFDSDDYHSLQGTQLKPDSEYCMFDNPEDIAVRFSTDGLRIFGGCQYSTAWPLIFIIYNLHPEIRTCLLNVLCVGIILGAKQCKDLNSFLIPVMEELIALKDSVETSGLGLDGAGYYFILRAFVIIGFGDIPAITKMLMIKAHNSITPCRTCSLQGIIYYYECNSIYYIPLMAPETRENFPPELLPLCTHKETLAVLTRLDDLAGPCRKAACQRVAQETGIIGRSIFAHLKSVDLSSSFPYDFMHLVFENLVPNMVRHWTSEFKGLDEGDETYWLLPNDWKTISRLTAQATKTIPSAFVSTIPDIAIDLKFFKAEVSTFWIQYLVPILLLNQLPEPYYSHMLLIQEIIMWSLQFKITRAEVDGLERMYASYRLPTCPLTMHALLHILHYIQRTGPPWASWAFVMEQFCGHILPAVKNCVHPYEHLNNFVQRRAQMQIVLKYKNGVEISSRETVYPEYLLLLFFIYLVYLHNNKSCLLSPVRATVHCCGPRPRSLEFGNSPLQSATTGTATHSLQVMYFHKIFSSRPMNTPIHPNRFIFPVMSQAHVEVEITPTLDFPTKLLSDANAVDHFGHIYVHSAAYCKMKDGAQHEFILFYLRDKTIASKETVIALDRVPRKERNTAPTSEDVVAEGVVDAASEPAMLEANANSGGGCWKFRTTSKPASSPMSVFLFGSLPALDRFTVSISGDTEQLCKTQDFESYQKIEELKINHANMSVEMLTIVACVVSQHCPMYNLYRYQCYWYASTVWDIVMELARANNDKNISHIRYNLATSTNNMIKGAIDTIRGTNNNFRFLTLRPPIDAADRPDAVIVKYHTAWGEFCRTAEPLKGVSETLNLYLSD